MPTKIVLRWFLFFLLLYLFLVAISLLGGAIKILGKEQADALFEGLKNPFAGLAVGVLSTVLVQSSSVTTSVIVAMVADGAVPFQHAIPMVMGANIGTSVTNTLVSLGYVTRREEFRRSFAGATVHDFFNVLSVIIFLPIELATGFLSKSAMWMTGLFTDVTMEEKFSSPVKGAIKWLAGHIKHFFSDVMQLEKGWLAAALFLLALFMIIGTLMGITRNMRILMANRIEVWINRALTKSGLLGLLIGIVITVAVQSSSITTSLLVPMFGAGILTLQAGFPVMIGANIGTTITALLAALVKPVGLPIALVHLLFNLCGTVLFFPFPKMREIPIRCAEKLADLAIKNRWWVLGYILVVFVMLPIAGILIWK